MINTFFKVNFKKFYYLVLSIVCIFFLTENAEASYATMKTYFDDRIKQKYSTFIIIANEDQVRDREFKSYSNIIARKLKSTHLKVREVSNPNDANFGLMLTYGITNQESKTANEDVYDEYPDPYNPEVKTKIFRGVKTRQYTDYTKVLDITIFSMEGVKAGEIPQDVVFNRSISKTDEGSGMNVRCMIDGAFSVMNGGFPGRDGSIKGIDLNC